VSDGIAQHRDGGLYDAELDKQNQSGRWHRVRLSVLQKHPICQRCDLSLSEIVDHVVPAAVAVTQARESGKYLLDRWAGYYLVSNLQGLCRPCHWTKTNEDKVHVGPWPDVVAKEEAAPKKKWSF
jgi:5-methylcytosine-specific restriction endonuclease McrA